MSGARIARTLAAIWDVALYLALAGLIVLVVTGGGAIAAGGVRISVRSVTNPLIALVVLTALRLSIWPSVAIAGLGVEPRSLPARALDLTGCLQTILHTVDERRARRWVAGIITVSAAIKLANILVYYGFFTGDDVEVQEMSFALLFDWQWTAWNLRSAIYPIVFIYPVQRLMLAAGVSDPSALVAGGRVVVLVWSSLAIWLTYVAGFRVSGRPGLGVLAAGLLAFSRTHVHLASTELPRSVAAAFLVWAFVLGIRESGVIWRAAGTGAAIAMGGVLRFSELLFAAPEALWRLIQRRWAAALVCCAACAVVATLLLGVGDQLYWGDAFFSARHLVQYTLVERQSSRGFEPWHFYLSHHAAWSNALVIGASLWSWRRGHVRLALWTWLPVIVLSALPHKEVRYLVPMLPFLSVGAALGMASWLEWQQTSGPVAPRQRAAAALVAATVVMAIFEIGGLRFPRSEDGVDLARALAAERVQHVVAEQAWRLGGRVYLPPPATVADLSPEQARGPELASAACRPEVEVVALRTVPPEQATAELASCGFSQTTASGSYTVYRRAPRR